MTDQQAADASKRIRNKVAGGAAARTDREGSTFPHYGRIAATHLGTAAAGPALQSIAGLVRRMRDGTTAGGKGSAAVKTLRGAARAAALVGGHLRRVDILTILEAIATPSPGEPDAPHQAAITDVLRLHAGDRFDTTLLTLDRLASGLERAAKDTPRLPRGAPRRPEVLQVALDQLERLWWQHRQVPPTQSINTEGFGALAKAVLTAPPCGYSEGTVRKAVAEYLKQASRPAAAAHAAPVPEEMPRIAAVAVIGDEHPLAEELTRQLRSDGVAVSRQPLSGVGGAAADVAPALPAGSLDVVVIVCMSLPFATGAARQERRLDRAAWPSAPDLMTMLPGRLHAVVTSSRQLLRSPGGKVVVLMPQPGGVAAAGGPDAYAAASTLAGVVMLVGMWAQDLAKDGIQVSAVFPGWGRDEQGLPNRHSQTRVTAAVLRETIARLGERQHGRLVDLYGEPAS